MTDVVPPELANACAEVRSAGEQDLVGGQPARFVAEPDRTDDAARLLRAAAALDLSVVPRGTATRLNWGSSPRSCDLIVSTQRLDKIIEHAAGDLVVRVQAGVTLDDLQAQLAREGQRLALDPPGGASIGGLVATNAAGPLRFRYGAPRDLLIGITIVRADGTVAKAGGKVVKNVAGYDLGKLFAGSYGTLGLIAEATFRLHPLPAASAYVTAEAKDAQAAAALVHAAARSPLAPSAIELDWPAGGQPLTVSVLLEGDEPSVAERADLMQTWLAREAAFVSSERAGRRSAHTKRADYHPGNLALGTPDTHIRVAFWPARLAEMLGCIRRSATASELDPAVGGAAASGVLDVSLAPDAPAECAAALVAELRKAVGSADGEMPAGSVVVLDAPAQVRELVDVWGPVPSLELMRAVKDQFDPGHRMAPGRFAGGI
jgi:glycolate oxidase FAD binding subunit